MLIMLIKKATILWLQQIFHDFHSTCSNRSSYLNGICSGIAEHNIRSLLHSISEAEQFSNLRIYELITGYLHMGFGDNTI